MARPKRNLIATAQATSTPPTYLTDGQRLAKVIKATGNNLYSVEFPSGATGLVELPARFRSTIWIKHGGYVLVDTESLQGRENKLVGEIVNIVRDEKEWRKESYWPKEFVRKHSYLEESDDEKSTVGKLPPTEPDEDE
ncbi:MAG: hypothetical protein M1835_002952 [Candelina submexicana]|nr:MAG: hypothetical protein M1835_002952 [Candelina submexicana]